MWPRTAALLATLLLAQHAVALDLEYVSHLSLYRPEIGLTEPSGLAVDPDGSGFWIVSDDTSTVFRLGADGDLGAFTGADDRMQDLEGVSVDVEAGRLLLVSERNASIVAVATAPPHRVSAVDVAALPGAEELRSLLEDRQNGLEGITVDPDTGAVFVLKEDAPRLLIEITTSLDEVVAVRRLDDVLPEGQDVSGLAVDPVRNGLWIVSDKGRTAHFLPDSGDAPGSIALTWRDGDRLRQLDNAEGVALSSDGRSLFILTDDGRNSLLVQYAILGAP